MKKIIMPAAMLLSFLAFKNADAQVRVNVNIGNPAPVYVVERPAAVSYYYLPEAEAYYYVPKKRYYYNTGGRWVSGAYLPQPYRSYNVYNVRHIVVNEPRPYLRHSYYRSKYNTGNRGYAHQVNNFYYKPGKGNGHGHGHGHGHKH